MPPRKKKRTAKDVEEELRIKNLLHERENSTRRRGDQLSNAKLRELVNNVITRQPSMVFTVLDLMENNEDRSINNNDESLLWCVCGNCKEMPTMAENVCCGYTECLAKSAEYALLVMEPMVLNIANGYRNDFFGLDETNNNEEYNKNLRHAAYRQFTMWRSGYLGAKNRKVIPSCCVWWSI